MKSEYWRAAASHYQDLIRKWRPLECIEIRDADPALPIAEKIRREGEKILAALEPRDIAVMLAESGQSLDSRAFAASLAALELRGRPVFVIGGPFGLAPEVLRAASLRLSLSPMTWPHELARVLLLEQLFRAESIARNFPYHH